MSIQRCSCAAVTTPASVAEMLVMTNAQFGKALMSRCTTALDEMLGGGTASASDACTSTEGGADDSGGTLELGTNQASAEAATRKGATARELDMERMRPPMG
ncbi:MAG: hypothetical protein K8S98_06715 [Planctomycetes bacterium]|nr:hypothetical protein [Planctomycetota bacterium]